MNTREFGETGFHISELGFGCGGFWGMKILSEKDAAKLVYESIEHGVNLFDTGSSYSNGNAESRLGRILKNIDKSKLLIGTKAGTHLSKNGKLYKDYSRNAITKSVEASLKKLELDYIPLLQLHGPPSDQIHQATDTLLDLKGKGIIKYIGVSGDGKIIENACDMGVFDCAMLTYNIMQKRSSLLIDKLYGNKMGILIKSPLAHTLYRNNLFKITSISDIWYLLRILKNYRHLLHERKKYKFINNIPGLTSNDVALNFVLKNNKVSCAVIGTTKIKHLLENIESIEKILPNKLYERIQNID